MLFTRIRLKFWPKPKPLLSNGGFCTKFGRKTAKISSSETRGFYTFNVDFELGVFTDFTKEKGRIKHFAAYFGLESRNESTMGIHSGK